jgi:TrpR-related protein YerC/YecD
MKSHRRLSAQQEARAERNLITALLTLRSAEECRAFLRDLCTPAELQAMADRWAVVECLRRGLPYREVHRQTAVSITTIGRVARYLAQGNGGYALAAQRIDGAPQGAAGRHPESPQRADGKASSAAARASARRAAQSGSAHG